MFHNYFFLKRLAHSLNKELSGLALKECFSQNKDELVLAFYENSRHFYIRANLDPIVSLLSFPETFARAGRNSVDLFQDLINKKIKAVKPFAFERSFELQFECNDSLIFKMHARRANILHHDGSVVKSIFRKNLSQDLKVTREALHQPIDISENVFASFDYDPLQYIPALGKDVKIFLERTKFNELDQRQKWVALNKLLSALESNPIWLIDSVQPRISLIDSSDITTHDTIFASNWLYETSVKNLFFEKEKDQLIIQLKQRIKKSENYIQKNQLKLHEMEEARNPEEIANILMANLHHIQTGLKKIVLTDIYTNQPITIKLNTTLSPQKNAETYYRKAKNRHQEIRALKRNIKTKKNLIEELSKQILTLLEIQTHKELRKFKKDLNLKQPKQKTENLPFHEFEMDGWKILVGKNSKANDELTLKIANKNDLWLHAKDVAGSHVILRQIPGQNFPKHIIEYAAGIAAANSKRKTDTLCPVIYTPKKFVRKVKGALPGQVIVEKEDIVMIEPNIVIE